MRSSIYRPIVPFLVRGAIAVLLVIAGGLFSGPAGLGPEPQSAEAALLSEVKKLLASDAQEFDTFGISVAVSGDTAVVGATQVNAESNRGAVYIFQRDQGGADNWGEVTRLHASDGAAFDAFGRSVAVSGDTVVVGANMEDMLSEEAGAAYVFRRDEGGVDHWGEVKKLLASDAQFRDEFGGSVAVNGDTVVVGANMEDAGGSEAGAAYVFQRDEGGVDNWGEVKKLLASDAQEFDFFGQSVAVSGDTTIVGAFGEDAGGSAAGAAYVFQRDQGGADNWGEVTKLTGSDALAADFFGQSVAVSGDTAVVGARGAFAGEFPGAVVGGAAYIFERDEGGAGNWGEVTRLTASDAHRGDFFGTSVAVSGDTVVVGAPVRAGGGAPYVFQRDKGGAGNWGQVKKVTASDAEAGDGFGESVAVNGDTAIVGAPGEDAGGSRAGAAYVFEAKAADGDTDGDGIPNGIDLDDDNDGCSDQQENGPDETLGGLRNPHNFWDFFDPNRDHAVGLLDFLAVQRHFNTVGDPATLDPDAPEPPTGEYWASADRGGQAPGGDPWDELPANGSIGLSDFLSVLRQFGHTCA